MSHDICVDAQNDFNFFHCTHVQTCTLCWAPAYFAGYRLIMLDTGSLYSIPAD